MKTEFGSLPKNEQFHLVTIPMDQVETFTFPILRDRVLVNGEPVHSFLSKSNAASNLNKMGCIKVLPERDPDTDGNIYEKHKPTEEMCGDCPLSKTSNRKGSNTRCGILNHQTEFSVTLKQEDDQTPPVEIIRPA